MLHKLNSLFKIGSRSIFEVIHFPRKMTETETGEHLQLGAGELESGHVDFTWSNLTYKVLAEQDVITPDGAVDKQKSWKQLLAGISGTARGGRLLAVMGPSGAGKTTLLNALAGRVTVDNDHVIDGACFLNRTALNNDHKRSMAFVTQDDILMPRDTPREAMYLSCRLRLGCDHEEALQRTTKILDHLHIEEARADVKLEELAKERKRTNIGCELIINPLVMFVDEATTGLDSASALKIGRTLRELAHSTHRTVICTIHCPSSSLYQVFDDVLLLAKGHVVYHGPLPDAVQYFAAAGYPLPPRTNPSEYFMKLLQMPDNQLNVLIDAWEAFRKSPAAVSNLSIMPAPKANELRDDDPVLQTASKHTSLSIVTQFMLLYKRALRNTLRDKACTIGRVGQILVFALILGIFFLNLSNDTKGVQDRLGSLCVMSMIMIMLTAMNGMVGFPVERAVFMMEQSCEAHNAFVYYIAKISAEIPLNTMLSIVFIAIAYFLMGLVSTFECFIAAVVIIIFCSNCGYSFGILLSCFFAKAEISLAVAPMVIMPMALVCGLFASTDRLEPTFTWVSSISFLRYGFHGMVSNELRHVGSLCPANATCQYADGDEVLKFLGFDDYGWGRDILGLGLLQLGMHILAALSLWYQGASRRTQLHFKVEDAPTTAVSVNESAAASVVVVHNVE